VIVPNENSEPCQLNYAIWPAAKNIHALVTTRRFGFSQGQYDSFNLAKHVGDNVACVNKNRTHLEKNIGENVQLFWLNQTHSNICVNWNSKPTNMEADASFTEVNNQACVVMTADCLPILLSNKQGSWVAACHAGWRGLADGVIQNTVAKYQGNKSDLIAWIGPAISQKKFEVGSEVKDKFAALNTRYNIFFQLNQSARYQFNFIGLAKYILSQFHIKCYGGNLCSFSENEKFYSYRRDGETGRMASLIWIE
jgi:polyphenol oxidase